MPRSRAGSRKSRTPPPPPAPAAEPGDGTSARQALARLAALLAQDDLAANDFLREQRPLLAAALGASALADLERLMKRYEYPPALALLHAVAG